MRVVFVGGEREQPALKGGARGGASPHAALAWVTKLAGLATSHHLEDRSLVA
jgi:hypothetical protein